MCPAGSAEATDDGVMKVPCTVLILLAAAACQGPGRSRDVSPADFVVHEVDGRLWVFRRGHPALTEFERQGEIPGRVVRVGAGPNGMTVIAPDRDTIDDYLATDPVHVPEAVYARPGFTVFYVDGRLWVFRADSEPLASYRQFGEPVECVVWLGAGPAGLTVRAPDRETLDAYLAK